MKIIGNDGKEYQSVEECKKAETLYEQSVMEKKQAESKKKKQLSEKIELADKELNVKREEFKRARQEATKIINKARKEASELIDKATEELQKASKNKDEAVYAFNKEYGPYKVSLEFPFEESTTMEDLIAFVNTLFSF